MNRRVLMVGLCLMAQARLLAQDSPVTQSTFNIGGGNATIRYGFEFDWSIGESTVISTYSGQNAYGNLIVGKDWGLTAGILQPFDKTRIRFNPLIDSWTNQEIRLFPVPTSDIVFIDFRSVITGTISIDLFSRDGKLLGSKEFREINGVSTQQWDLRNQPAGAYYFQIVLRDNNGVPQKSGTFNIEKL